MYEKYLKYALKDYIHSEEVYINSQIASTFNTPEELCQFVMWLHDSYINSHESMESNKNMGSYKSVRRDCKYIVTMTHIVTAGILHLMEINRNLEEGYIEREKTGNWRILQTFQGKFISDKMYSIPFRKQRKEWSYIKALYGNYSVYVMPYDIFIEKVDPVQYPDTKQQYCFEEVQFQESQHIDNQCISKDIERSSEQSEVQIYSKIQSNMEESNADGVDSRLLMFLDAAERMKKN